MTDGYIKQLIKNTVCDMIATGELNIAIEEQEYFGHVEKQLIIRHQHNGYSKTLLNKTIS